MSNRAATEEIASLLVGTLSAGRRKRTVLDVGPVRAFQTDLSTVTVPFPLPAGADIRTLTLALALQSSPTKELAASLAWPSYRESQRIALAWVEGEHAVRWAHAAWPGLREDLMRAFPWVDSRPAAQTAEQLVSEAKAATVRRLSAPPALFGLLPPYLSTKHSTAGKPRMTAIGTKWIARLRAKRPKASLAIPVSGPAGEQVTHPGEAGGLEALMGHAERQFGIPYDEWDHRLGRYRRAYARVLEIDAQPPEDTPADLPPALHLPPLMPSRHLTRRREQSEIDIDAVVAHRCDMAAGRTVDEPKLFKQLVPVVRPVAFALLIDASASSIGGRGSFLRTGVRQANAVARSLTGAGHRVGAFAFRSRSHERVEVRLLKEFAAVYTPFGQDLKPAGYTRVGPALRHVGRRLEEIPAEAKVLMIFGDGVPSDEGYDGRYGRADVAKAVEELGARGIAVRHVLPESRESAELDEMFGPSGWRTASSTTALRNLLAELAHDVGS